MSGGKPVILAVEDDERVLGFNRRRLERRGYRMLCAATAAEARSLFDELPDLLILDIRLPDGSGYDLCSEYRRKSRVPVIFLSGLAETGDRVRALGAGGDYYITKPYDFEELLACVERLWQRELRTREERAETTTLTRGPLTLDIPKRRARLDGKDVDLTPKEFSLLLALMRDAERVMANEDLLREAWNAPPNNNLNALYKQVSRLRAKLGADDRDDFSIVSAHGRGYLLTTE